MISACGRWVLVFNGEIYNYLELREELNIREGERAWRSHSDTETLLAAIAAFGVQKTLEKIVGMFAFILWDRGEKTLYLARDRLGEKPLYYGWQAGKFLFASELKAIVAHPAFQAKLNHQSICQYLHNNYIAAPQSIYEGIFKLEPGHYLVTEVTRLRAGDTGQSIAYWSLEQAAVGGMETPFDGSLVEAADELERLLLNTVKQQMLSDVPLGAFLSGGIDSSLVVALMQKLSERPVKTFTIAMPDRELDESAHALAVADSLNTDHVTQSIGAHGALDMIPSMNDIWDEPFADSSQIPTLLVCKTARQHVTVALSGDGADEIFLGYNHYRRAELLWRSRFGGRALNVVSGLSPTRFRHRLRTAAFMMQARDHRGLARRLQDRYRFYPVPYLNCTSVHEQRFAFTLPDPALSSALHDAISYLPDDILVKVDRAAMSVSLETRAPFLDHRIVEFAWRLPLSHKLHFGETKRVLREIVYRHVPRELLERRKQGFSVPVAHWLRSNLKHWGEEFLSNGRLFEFIGLDQAAINEYWCQHQSGRYDHSERLWGILVLLSFVREKFGV